MGANAARGASAFGAGLGTRFITGAVGGGARFVPKAAGLVVGAAGFVFQPLGFLLGLAAHAVRFFAGALRFIESGLDFIARVSHRVPPAP
jgi:hypothetical protein